MSNGEYQGRYVRRYLAGGKLRSVEVKFSLIDDADMKPEPLTTATPKPGSDNAPWPREGESYAFFESLRDED